MGIKTQGDEVIVNLPGVGGEVVRCMTLEQYERHKRDGAFDAQMKSGATVAEKSALDAAIAAVAPAVDVVK